MALHHSYAWVKFRGEPLWHARLVMGSVESLGTNRALAAPDFDVCVEDIENDEHVEAFYFSDVGGPPPAGVPRQNAYRFAVEPTDIQIREW